MIVELPFIIVQNPNKEKYAQYGYQEIHCHTASKGEFLLVGYLVFRIYALITSTACKSFISHLSWSAIVAMKSWSIINEARCMPATIERMCSPLWKWSMILTFGKTCFHQRHPFNRKGSRCVISQKHALPVQSLQSHHPKPWWPSPNSWLLVCTASSATVQPPTRNTPVSANAKLNTIVEVSHPKLPCSWATCTLMH